MKRSLFLAALLGVVVAFTSCIREDDFEMMRHPIHVQGEIDPNWSVPVAYGDVNLNDLVSMLSQDYTGYLDTSNIITVMYKTSLRDSVTASTSKRNHRAIRPLGGRKDATWYTKDTTIRIRDIDLDFFENAEISSLIDSTQLALRHLWVKFNLGLWCNSQNDVSSYIRGTFDSVRLFYESRDGEVIDFADAHRIAISVDHVNDTASYVDSLDMAEIVNSVPRKIHGSVRLRVQVSSNIIPTNISDMTFEEILDSLNARIPSITKLVYHADARVEMPLIMQVGNLPYSFDLDMQNGASLNVDSMLSAIDTGIHMQVEDSRFRLAVENNLPFDLSLSATMLDANGNPLRDNMGRQVEDIFPLDTISAAAIRQIGLTGDYEAAAPTRDTLTVLLNQEKLDYFKDAKKLRIKLRLVSPIDPANPTKHSFVAIRRTDFLKLKASIQVHPRVRIDMGVTDGGLF